MFARDGVITALDTHVKGIQTPSDHSVLPAQYSLDLFELMGAGDACFLVELLKLAVSDKCCATLKWFVLI